MAIPFANQLRVHTLKGRLRAVWCHPANELAGAARATPAAAIARALGLIAGSSDFLFLWKDGAGALEAKSDVGRLSPGQKDFRDWCDLMGVPFHVFRTADEGESYLRGWGVLDD